MSVNMESIKPRLCSKMLYDELYYGFSMTNNSSYDF